MPPGQLAPQPDDSATHKKSPVKHGWMEDSNFKGEGFSPDTGQECLSIPDPGHLPFNHCLVTFIRKEQWNPSQALHGAALQ
jgi:hypothetical protein